MCTNTVVWFIQKAYSRRSRRASGSPPCPFIESVFTHTNTFQHKSHGSAKARRYPQPLHAPGAQPPHVQIPNWRAENVAVKIASTPSPSTNPEATNII